MLDPHPMRYTQELLRTLKRVQRELPSCPACFNYNEKGDYCDLSPIAGRPPTLVIAYGCEKFEPDIPF